MECVCGSGFVDAECCAPLLAGTTKAITAAALMRSRYTAYVRGAVEYLLATHDPAQRAILGDVRAEILKFTRATTWLGLEIVATEAGGETDRTGIVEFIARGVTRGKPFAQHERSRFRRDSDGNWLYVAGELR